MINPAHRFQDVLDAASNLSLDEQQTLLSILQRRIAELERVRIAQDVAEARREFQGGSCEAMSLDDLMDEVDRES